MNSTFIILVPSPFVAIILTIYVVFKLWKYLSHYTLYGIVFLLFILPFNFIAGRVSVLLITVFKYDLLKIN